MAADCSVVVAQAIQWVPTIEQAKERAVAENKPILLHFGSEDCGPCRNLEQFVFTDPRIGQAINDRFVAVKIDTKRQAKLAEQYQVTRIPHDIVLTPDGQVAYRRMSPANASAYQEMLKAGSNFSAQTSPRSQQVVEAMSGLVREQQEDLNRSPFYGEQAAQAGTVNGWPTNNQAVSQFNGTLPPANVRQTAAAAPAEFDHGNQMNRPGPTHSGPEANFPAANYRSRSELPAISNPFPGGIPPAGLPATGQLPAPGAMPAGQGLSQSNDPNLPLGAPRSGVSSRSESQNSTTSAERSANAYYQEPETAIAGLPTQKVPTTIPNEHHVQQVAANLETAASPIGLESYCPVTLLSSQKWVKGNANIGCYHRGVLYMFADQTAMDRFMTAPDRWSPLLGGFDPVIMANENRLEPGKRRFGVFCETTPGQAAIVLFTNEANRDRFKQDSEQFLKLIRDVTAKADQE
ncbi:MAG: DUF255 domain-containing protein [Planctomycetaceae bacterium]|nr:DUF255 domain-containing protein [Planctomycetaceae bacterium]